MSVPAADPGQADDDRLREFLADSLALWGVAGTVEAGAAPVVAHIRATGRAAIAVARADDPQSPFRWFVRVEPRDDAAARPARPCGSIVGVLNALRSALAVERGGRVRIVPGAGGG